MAANVLRWSYKIERKLLLMSKKSRGPIDSMLISCSFLLLFIGILAMVIIYVAFPTNYVNAKSYVSHEQKMVMQTKFLHHDANNVRYRVKIYSASHDASGVPVWKYVKTVDYGHQKPDLRE